ncbi:MAG: hypothetical protein WCS92_03050 [Candidatus Babeliales bacterium]|jgi:WD40 repeat protein
MKKFSYLFLLLFVICCSENYYAGAMSSKLTPCLAKIACDKIVSDILRSHNPVDMFRKAQSSLPVELIQEVENELFNILSFDCKQQYDLFQTIQSHNAIASVCISMDNQLIVTGGNDSSVKIWRFNGKGYEYFQTLPGHFAKRGMSKKDYALISSEQDFFSVPNMDRVDSVLISLDNNLIITGSIDDDSVNIWKFNGSEYTYFQQLACNSLVLSISISQDQQIIIVGCDDNTIRFWYFDGNKYNEGQNFSDPNVYPENLKFSSDKRTVTCCSMLGGTPSIRILKLDEIEPIGVPQYRLANTIVNWCSHLNAADLSEDRDIIVVASEDLNVLRLNGADYSCSLLQQLSTGGWAQFVKVSYDKSLIMAGRPNDKIEIWKFIRQQDKYVKIQEIDCQFGVSKGDLSVNGHVVVLTGDNGCINIWKRISLEKLLEIYAKKCQILAVE